MQGKGRYKRLLLFSHLSILSKRRAPDFERTSIKLLRTIWVYVIPEWLPDIGRLYEFYRFQKLGRKYKRFFSRVGRVEKFWIRPSPIGALLSCFSVFSYCYWYQTRLPRFHWFDAIFHLQVVRYFPRIFPCTERNRNGDRNSRIIGYQTRYINHPVLMTSTMSGNAHRLHHILIEKNGPSWKWYPRQGITRPAHLHTIVANSLKYALALLRSVLVPVDHSRIVDSTAYHSQ